jgi:hypothetical protein
MSKQQLNTSISLENGEVQPVGSRLELEQEQALTELVDSLPKEVTPPTDIWPKIVCQLNNHLPNSSSNPSSIATNLSASVHFWQGFSLAASLAIVALVTWKTSELESIAPQFSSVEQELVATGSMILNPEIAALEASDPLVQLVNDIATRHELQLQALNQLQFQTDNRVTIPAGLALLHDDQVVSQGLVELRLAATEIQKALINQPTNQQLWQLWLWVLKRELSLLKQVKPLILNYSQPEGNSI